MRHFRNALYALVGILLGFNAVIVYAIVPWNGSRTQPGSVYLNGPNGLPWNADTGKYVNIGDLGGGVELQGKINSNLGGKALQIGTAEAIGARGVAKVAVSLAKLAGPIGIGIQLANLLWNEPLWLKEEETQGGTGGPWAWNGSNCQEPYPSLDGLWCMYQTVHPNAGSRSQFDFLIEDIGPDTQRGWVQFIPTGIWSQFTATRIGTTCPDGFVMTNGVCIKKTSRPATDIEIEDAIYTELVAHGMGSDLARRLIAAGYETDLVAERGPVSTSGPASIQGPASSTVTNSPSGTTTTTNNTTYNITYQGANVTATQVTTSITNSPAGTTTSTTTTPGTEPATSSAQDTTYSLDFENAQLPAIEGFYSPHYPEGLKGVWNEKKAQLQSTSLVGVLHAITDGAPTSGTCPAWYLSWDLGSVHKSANVAPPCYIWPWLQAFLFICALFLCRRLIFGG